MSKTVEIGELFTRDELKRAAKLYLEAEPGTFAKRAAAEIVEPILPRINQALGQENDAKYLAYALEFAFTNAQ